jgi:hypothetical protein
MSEAQTAGTVCASLFCGADSAHEKTWTFAIEPAGNESRTMVTITEDGEAYNPVFRFVSRFVLGQAHTIDAYLKAMASTAGEEIQIED